METIPLSEKITEAVPDSIMLYSIPEVVIEQNRQSFFNEDKKVSMPDSLTMAVFSSADAGLLLSLFTPAYINTSGGPGSSSSLFLRGTNSYQTTVKWNGFLLNSLTLGTMDFSMIPVAAAGDVSVVHGAAGSIAGSGNFGGSVLLRNRADWDKRLQVGVRSELGSYDNRQLSLSAKIGNRKLQYQLYAFSHQAENNFSYTDTHKPGNPLETAQNNTLNNLGVIQNLFVRLPRNNKIEAGFWYQSRTKELPAIMGSYLPASAMQRDSSLRVYAKWTKSWSRSSFSFNTAMFDEYMLFRDKNLPGDNHYSIDSGIHSGQFAGDMNYRYQVTRHLTVDGGLEASLLSADVNSYGGRVNEMRSAAITAMKLRWRGLTGNLSLRKEFQRNIDIPLLFSAGIKKELPVRGLAVKTSYSDQFRIPSFNDRYWQPGGNPQLLPESGYTADLGMVQDITLKSGTGITAEISAYISEINDMIQWVPSGTQSWWRPENRQVVQVRGVESSLMSTAGIGQFDFIMGLSHNFVKSQIGAADNVSNTHDGNQLMYVPVHNGSARAGLSSEKSFFGVTGNYTGSRFTGNDNNPQYMMPSFLVFNGYAGHRIKVGDIGGQIQVRIMNLFNNQYQVVRSYPMPGRTFHLSFSLDLNQ
ncbi:MAG: TonB-dependent receptor plug domain-containing protein [Bacteroidales bacterium]